MSKSNLSNFGGKKAAPFTPKTPTPPPPKKATAKKGK